MKNIYFPEEEITSDDLYFICYMIEKVARQLKQRNKYVVNAIGAEGFRHLLSCAQALHCENPLKVASDWISDYSLEKGDFDITDVDPELAEIIPYRTGYGRCISAFDHRYFIF